MHWNIGKLYKDHKRNKICILHAVSPYKAKSGSYLDFKYLDGKYIRQSAAKALSRFEAYDKEVDMSQFEIEQLASGFSDRLFSSLTLDGGLFHTPTKQRPKSKTDKQLKKLYDQASKIDTSNVIFVDFINKCRVA